MDWLGLAGFIKPEARKYDGGGIVTKIKKKSHDVKDNDWIWKKAQRNWNTPLPILKSGVSASAQLKRKIEYINYT